MFFLRSVKTKMLLLVTVLTMLGACKEVLYSDLTEGDANEMMALLVLSGIDASREKAATGAYSLLVDDSELAVAVTVLRNSGLPRERFQSMGDVFGDVGVVGTPFEERVRFAYATNQELSQTISQIKGIDSARVHVVIPPRERFGGTTTPARASIVIFHDRSFDPAQYTSRVKALVAFAVPDLAVEDISANFFLSPGFVVEQRPAIAPQGTASASDGSTQFLGNNGWMIGSIGLFLILLLLVRVALLGLRKLGAPTKVRRNA